MSAANPFEQSVAAWLESLEGTEPPGLQHRAVARARETGQRPAWLARADLIVGTPALPVLPPGAIAAFVLVVALLAVLALGVLVGGRVQRPELGVVPTDLPAPSLAAAPDASPPGVIRLAGSWRSLPAAAMPSTGLTATPLLDGRVLVAGPVASLLDPSTGTWTEVRPPREPRRDAVAARLADGRVLLVGGVSDADGFPLASAELFDPLTAHWTAAGSMSVPRAAGHTATTLLDGRVLVAAGTAWDSKTQLDNALVNSVPSAELFDPRTGAWTATGELNKARSGHTATLLEDGRVLVTGGRIVHSLAMADAELFDPASGTWLPAASMSSERYEHAAVRLADGSVVVVGGQLALKDDGPSTLAERYDPATDDWSQATPMAMGRYRMTATRLADGGVLVAGGTTPAGPTNAAELYDPTTNVWTQTEPMAFARSGQAAALLENGWALVIGGGPTSTTTQANGVERFFPGVP
jgi:galactose oxidase-like protein/Kelch motif protein